MFCLIKINVSINLNAYINRHLKIIKKLQAFLYKSGKSVNKIHIVY